MSHQIHESDLLIIGVGAGGGTCALRAADMGMKVTVVTASSQPDSGSSTSWAQGGIIFRGRADSPAALAEDIQRAGHGICYQPAVDLTARRGPRIVEELLIDRCTVPFDRSNDGEWDLTEEGAHSCPRIIHVEDATGRAIANQLAREVAEHPGIELVTNATALDLIMHGTHTSDPTDIYDEPRCLGAYIFRDGRADPFIAKETVLATGGLGQIFLHTTNPRRARGDGIAMAWRCGARVINLEYIQFHPTAFYHRLAPRFLMSESLRGEGARLVTRAGRPFMKDYHEQGDLAPRDVVARCIHQEMVDQGDDCVYLDFTHKDANWIRGRFPQINEFLQSWGVDMTSQPIPVVPAAHYSCGGIAVDLHGKTNVKGLRAVGESSCTGLHGANRLASTSLLEAITWGYQTAENVFEEIPHIPMPRAYKIMPWEIEHEEADPALINQDWMTIKQTMWNYVGLIRKRRRLRRALKILRDLQFEIENFYREVRLGEDIIGLRNGVQTALAVTHSAFRNRTSRGGHYRVD